MGYFNFRFNTVIFIYICFPSSKSYFALYIQIWGYAFNLRFEIFILFIHVFIFLYLRLLLDNFFERKLFHIYKGRFYNRSFTQLLMW